MLAELKGFPDEQRSTPDYSRIYGVSQLGFALVTLRGNSKGRLFALIGEKAKHPLTDMNKEQAIKEWYSAIGRKGGSAKSARKTKANRENAQKRWANRVCENVILKNEDSGCNAK